jgi:hypothetical protein
MVTIERASELLNTPVNAIKRFNRDDVFNGGNTIGGFISLRPGSAYGALVIDTVNGVSFPDGEEQVIFGMPKLHYPFGKRIDGSRIYNWPSDSEKLYVSEKWDGTNICNFVYHDITGNLFSTYKTRLTPIAGNSGDMGDFADLVKLVTSRPDWEPYDYPEQGRTICYELCGYRNPHLVRYDFDIKMIPICYITNFGSPCIYPALTDGEIVYNLSFDMLTERYTKSQEIDENIIVASETEQGEFPLEGKVFYVYAESTGGWVPVKCKPKMIEDIHFARGGIDNIKIREACFKALEMYPIEQVTHEIIEEILLEDYHPEAVTCSFDRITIGLDEIKHEAIQRKMIRSLVEEAGWEFKEHPKGDLMRMLSKGFCGTQMRRVFSSAKAMGLVLPDPPKGFDIAKVAIEHPEIIRDAIDQDIINKIKELK